MNPGCQGFPPALKGRRCRSGPRMSCAVCPAVAVLGWRLLRLQRCRGGPFGCLVRQGPPSQQLALHVSSPIVRRQLGPTAHSQVANIGLLCIELSGEVSSFQRHPMRHHLLTSSPAPVGLATTLARRPSTRRCKIPQVCAFCGSPRRRLHRSCGYVPAKPVPPNGVPGCR
jgi:hypothetical protein